jgi:hemerythrin-like domain-containing protein
VLNGHQGQPRTEANQIASLNCEHGNARQIGFPEGVNVWLDLRGRQDLDAA